MCEQKINRSINWREMRIFRNFRNLNERSHYCKAQNTIIWHQFQNRACFSIEFNSELNLKSVYINFFQSVFFFYITFFVEKISWTHHEIRKFIVLLKKLKKFDLFKSTNVESNDDSCLFFISDATFMNFQQKCRFKQTSQY